MAPAFLSLDSLAESQAPVVAEAAVAYFWIMNVGELTEKELKNGKDLFLRLISLWRYTGREA